MKQEIILGLHGFSADSDRQMHDAGVCLLVDGEIVAAVDEERLSRTKRDGQFPMRSYRAALNLAGIDPREIDAVAFVDRRSPWQTIQVWRYALEAFLRTGVQPWRYLRFWSRQMLHYKRIPPTDLPTRNHVFLEHHRCHAASAYYAGPWDRATVVTLDGMGDFSVGGSVSMGANGHLDLLKRSNGYFSPGHFYMIVTEYLGFTPGRHEGKITGLAAHGDPNKAYETMKQVISYRAGKLDFIAGPVAEEFFNVIRSCPGKRTRQWYSQDKWATFQNTTTEKPCVPSEEDGLVFFRRLWAGYSREEIAAAAQKRFEDVIAEYVTDAVLLVGESKLVVAGGCFANVRLNQHLAELPEIDGVFINPNMSDGGLSAGAALLLHHAHRKQRREAYVHRPWEHVYYGLTFSNTEIKSVLEKEGVLYRQPSDILVEATKALIAGKVIALFQGRMEYGPRALGNRSLIAAAIDPEMPDILNERLGRTEFMPFAPVILEESAKRWFQKWTPNCVASRFMTITYDVDPVLAQKVPAVVHVDGTARPQVLRQKDNALLHALLVRYQSATGIPLLINTSFNMHEEPIVCSPAEALHSFCRGAADVMIIGDLWVDPSNLD